MESKFPINFEEALRVAREKDRKLRYQALRPRMEQDTGKGKDIPHEDPSLYLTQRVPIVSGVVPPLVEASL